MKPSRRFFLAALAALGVAQPGFAAEQDAAPGAWPAITAQCRPWTRWWWMGSAVDEADLSRELVRYQAAGLGGVEITPIYGVVGNERNDIPFLSPKWMSMLDSTISAATRLGMAVDMTMGTGWCFGGPLVGKSDACAQMAAHVQPAASGTVFTGTYNPTDTQALAAFSSDGKYLDLRPQLRPDGSLRWTPPAGQWKVYAISQKPTGLMVKRSAPGGAGPMVNPFYPDAISRYLNWFDGPFAKTKPPLDAVFQDSYEYDSEWSPDFFSWFEQLRGYRLQEHLPDLIDAADAEKAARLKSDYRETISDLLVDHAMPIWVKWAHHHHYLVRYQAHGAPANLLDLYAIADIPETEFFFKDRDILVSKFASSAAHTKAENLVSAETGTWLSEHFNETLAAMKSVADDLFLSGINHVVYHGTAYSPDDAPWPGWCFYAASEMNPRNAIWHDDAALNDYIARCQSLLQSGTADNDVLLYWPIYDCWNDPHGLAKGFAIDGKGWFHGQPVESTATRLWNAGYAFDYISDRQLMAMKGAPRNYRAVVIPSCNLMPLETLQELADLAAAGIPVIFDGKLPDDVPGFKDLDSRRSNFQSLLGSAKTHFGIGDAVTLLSAKGIPHEDLTGLEFVRRRSPDCVTYFIANRRKIAMAGSFKLNTAPGAVELMDPITGRTGLAHVEAPLEGGVRIQLSLDAGQTIFVRVFTRARIPLGLWRYPGLAGAAIPLAGEWNIKFIEGGPTLPPSIQTAVLGSWTALSDERTRSFAGTAVYSIHFDAPSAQSSKWSLDLGKVCESARVRLNGEDLGTLIAPPYVVHGVTLRPHDNLLEVEVTSSSANRIRDLDIRHVKWKIFDKPNILNTNYKAFDASRWPLKDCGLLGPVVIIPET